MVQTQAKNVSGKQRHAIYNGKLYSEKNAQEDTHDDACLQKCRAMALQSADLIFHAHIEVFI